MRIFIEESSHKKPLKVPIQKFLISDTQNLTKKQLLTVRRLKDCTGLPPELEKELRAEKPCLFTDEGCD